MTFDSSYPGTTIRTSKKLSTEQIQVLSLEQQGAFLLKNCHLNEAKIIYEKLLKLQPNNFDALQILGALSAQEGKFKIALDLLSKAISINPSHAGVYSNRGIVLKELNLLEEALSSYDKAIKINPNYAEAYSNRGVALKVLGRFEDAIASHDQAIRLDPYYAEAYFNRGRALAEMGQLNEALADHDQAIKLNPNYAEGYSSRGIILKDLNRLNDAHDSFNMAISINPNYAEAFLNRGNLLNILKRTDEALTSFDKAISIKCNYPEAHSNRGNALKELGRLDEALASYDKAIRIKSNYAEAYSNRGNALKELGRLDEALASFDKAISIKSNYAEAHSNRGNVLKELGRLDDALASYDEAISINSNYAEAYSNRGNAFFQLYKFDEALASFDKSISINPDYAEAYYNKGVTLKNINRLNDSVASFQNAIRLNPNYASANWNLALCNLLGGNFKDGWEGYEWRWRDPAIAKIIGVRNFNQPLWLGEESIKGKTIFLHAEQGFGDTIQFSRYVLLVSKLGAKVILEVQRPLLDLLKNLEGINYIIAKGDPIPIFDYHCPLLSLPLALKTQLNTIPPQSKITGPDIEKIASWQTRLGDKYKPRVGLVWSGNAKHANDRKRSIAFSELLPHLPPNVDYFCLQQEVRDSDKVFLAEHNEIKFFGNELRDFTDTAAMCSLMDLVISVDTSVAHLAGSMGKNTWVLLPYNPDWRWLIDRNDSPWYPSVRLYRQIRIGDWDDVLNRVKAEMQSMLFLESSKYTP